MCASNKRCCGPTPSTTLDCTANRKTLAEPSSLTCKGTVIAQQPLCRCLNLHESNSTVTSEHTCGGMIKRNKILAINKIRANICHHDNAALPTILINTSGMYVVLPVAEYILTLTSITQQTIVKLGLDFTYHVLVVTLRYSNRSPITCLSLLFTRKFRLETQRPICTHAQEQINGARYEPFS